MECRFRSSSCPGQPSYPATALPQCLGHFQGFGSIHPDSLVGAEPVQAGGAFTVRGYKEGTLIADKGMVSSVEARVPLQGVSQGWKPPPLAEQSGKRRWKPSDY
ncbi:MAG: ShlB/FhaC/HecB family hemolysin secretion/activation protein [Vampirovibrionales bacterium]